jgi:hypothetical protein
MDPKWNYFEQFSIDGSKMELILTVLHTWLQNGIKFNGSP